MDLVIGTSVNTTRFEKRRRKVLLTQGYELLQIFVFISVFFVVVCFSDFLFL
jgi:hypothetical protein